MTYQAVDTSRLHRLSEDMPLTMKVPARWHYSKKRLQVTVGDLLRLLQLRSRLTLRIVVNPAEVQLCCMAPREKRPDGAVMHGTTPASGANDKECLGSDTLCGSDDEHGDEVLGVHPPCSSDNEPRGEGPGDDTLSGPASDFQCGNTQSYLDNELVVPLEGPASSQEEDQNDVWWGKMVTFANNQTGRTITMPAHDEMEGSGDWSPLAPGPLSMASWTTRTSGCSALWAASLPGR